MGENIVTFEDVRKFGGDKNETIIDVRDPKELQETGVIPGSINIPLAILGDAFQKLSDEEFKAKFGRQKPNKESPITVSCKMGGRSIKAHALLQGLGFSNIKNYSGGWMDWEKNLNK